MEMNKKEIIVALKRAGWGCTKSGWISPYHKRAFHGISLREAASIEGLESCENLGRIAADVDDFGKVRV